MRKSTVYLITILLVTALMPFSQAHGESPANQNNQAFDCSIINMEKTISRPADVVSLVETTDELPVIGIEAATVETGENVPILLVTDPDPLELAPDNAEVLPGSVPAAPVLTITAANNVNVRSGPSTNDGVVGTVIGGTSIEASARNAAGDWVQITFTDNAGTEQTGWVFVSLFNVDGSVSDLPEFNATPTVAPPPATDDPQAALADDETETSNLYMVVPFHPDNRMNGGEIAITITDGTTTCDPVVFTIGALSRAPGAFEEMVEQMGTLLELQRESLGITRDELLAVEPANLPIELASLAITQRLYDGPDNLNSMVRMADGSAENALSEEDMAMLDAMVEMSGLLEYLEDEIAAVEELLEQPTTGFIIRRSPMDSMMKPSGKPAQQSGIDIGYAEIDDAEDLAREMRKATRAMYKLNHASGKVLNDLGRITAAVSPFLTKHPVFAAIFDLSSQLIFIEKTRLEFEAYGGPTKFTWFKVDANPDTWTNENETDTGEWSVDVIAESQPWNVTVKVYDIARVADVVPGNDAVLAGIDVVANSCDRPGNPCGEVPQALVIPPYPWTVNDMTDHEIFEVERLDYLPGASPPSFALVEKTNLFMPVNAGTTPLRISAPGEKFGSYEGDGRDIVEITVGKANIEIYDSSPTRPLELPPGETANICFTATIANAHPEDNHEIQWQGLESDGTILNEDRTRRAQDFCFTIGPVEPSTWDENCVLDRNWDSYLVIAEGILQQGPRKGAEWHPESNPETIVKVFRFDVYGEPPEQPDDCGPRAGVWMMVPQNFSINCPTFSQTTPYSGQAIPITIDSLNAGTAVFGMVGDVLTMPGAQLLPPETVQGIQEADQQADELQVDESDLQGGGELPEGVEIDRNGNTYTVTQTLPDDMGSVVTVLRFSNEKDTFEGQMGMQMTIPNVGTCTITLPFTGYYEGPQ